MELFTLFPQTVCKVKLENHQRIKETFANDLINKYKSNPNHKFEWAAYCDSWQEDANPYMGELSAEFVPHINTWLQTFKFSDFNYIIDSWFNVHTSDMYQEAHCHMEGPVVLCGVYYMQLSKKDNPVVFTAPSVMYQSHICNLGLKSSHPFFSYNSTNSLSIEEGDLLLFTPDNKHFVPKSSEKHDGYRISLSFNVQKE
tara:strand:+ start:59 stop:655 length:597 start_codon:yes stop_codon:yes gene_type:complete